MDGKDALIYLAIKYNGEWDKIYEAIQKKEALDEDDVKKELKALAGINIKTITIIDDIYPAKLKHMNKPPFVLFYKTREYKDDISKIFKTHNFAILSTNNGINQDKVSELMDNISKCSIAQNFTVILNGNRNMNLHEGYDETTKADSIPTIIYDKVNELKPLALVSVRNGICTCYANSGHYEIQLSAVPYETKETTLEQVNTKMKIITALSKNIIIAEAYKGSDIERTFNFASEVETNYSTKIMSYDNSNDNALLYEGTNWTIKGILDELTK